MPDAVNKQRPYERQAQVRCDEDSCEGLKALEIRRFAPDAGILTNVSGPVDVDAVQGSEKARRDGREHGILLFVGPGTGVRWAATRVNKESE